MDWLYLDALAVLQRSRLDEEGFAEWHSNRVPSREASRIPSTQGLQQAYRDAHGEVDNSRLGQLQAASNYGWPLHRDLPRVESPFRLVAEHLPGFVCFEATLIAEFSPTGFWGLFRSAGVGTMLVEPPQGGLASPWDAVRMPLYLRASCPFFSTWYRFSTRHPLRVEVVGHAVEVSPTALEVMPLSMHAVLS